MRRHLFLISASFLLLFVVDVAAAPVKTIDVDCSKGKTIGAALQDDAPALTIRFRGTCNEAVLIERDNVAIEGLGEAAIDGATLPEPKPDGVTVRGATNVSLAGFAVRGMRYGVSAVDGASLSLDRMTLEVNFTGLFGINGVNVRLNDVTARRNERYGISLWTGCSANVFGKLVASGNGRGGVLLDSSAMSSNPGTVIEADDNQVYGLLFQQGTSALLTSGVPTSVFTRRNGTGIFVESSTVWVSMLQSLDNQRGVHVVAYGAFRSGGTFSGNTEMAVSVDKASLVTLRGATITHNLDVAIRAHRSSVVDLADSSVQGNQRGIVLDDSSITMTGTIAVDNIVSDVNLHFGSRGTFASNTLGTISCDATVLVRGDVACPAELAYAGSERPNRPAFPTGEPLGPELVDP